MNLSGKIYLAECWHDILSSPEGTVISLAPQVSYQLGRRNIPYHILEDFYKEEELRLQETDYFHSQLSWIKVWDQYLQSKIPFLQSHLLEVARLYYNRIKYFVDPVIIQSYILDKVLSAIHPQAEVFFVRNVQAKRPKTMQAFKFTQDSSCFPELFPKLCAKHHIAHHQFLDAQIDAPSTTEFSTTMTKVFHKIKAWIAHKLKPLLFYIKFSKNKTTVSRHSTRKENVLFMHSGSNHLDPVIQEFVNEQHRVFLIADKQVYSLNRLAPRQHLLLDEANAQEAVIREIRKQSLDAAEAFRSSDSLLDWIKNRANLDVTDYVFPFFKNFIQEVIPEILGWTIRLEAFLKRQKIAYIVTHTSSDILSKSAVLAGKMTGAKSICIQHGCDVFHDPVWLITDLDPFDFYLSTDDLSKQKFTAATLSPFIQSCKVLESPHYLMRLKGLCPLRNNYKIKRILYIPTKLSMHGRYFNCLIYPVLWYFEYQKQLVRWMASQNDKTFIFKQGKMMRKYADESIMPFIEKLTAPNIKIANGPTTEYFSSVDAVIMDRPSTAFFEATSTGLPVLCLYANFTEAMIHPHEKNFFGASLQSFSSAPEAIERIISFLNSNSLSDYTHNLPLKSDQIAQQIATAQLV